MLYSFSLDIMHLITSWLLQPVVWGLLFFTGLAIYEFGLALGERLSVIPALQAAKQKQALISQGKKRIERADFITRIAPMLGLMGTLIPLGPGLSALGSGDISILTTAMTVAFDTTIIGLLAGVIGFVLGRMRRRWYDNAIGELERLEIAASATDTAKLTSVVEVNNSVNASVNTSVNTSEKTA